MKKIMGLIVVIMAISFVSCSSKTNIEYGEYERCIVTTSTGDMAETEDGFFYLFNEMLYYGDKTNMNLFVPVCNKPDCSHKSMDSDCNACISSESLAQKDSKLYGVDVKGIFEIHTDGSGKTYIMEVPSYKGDEAFSFRAMLTQNQLLIYNKYLTETGMFQKEWLRFDEGEWYSVFSKQYEQDVHTWSISGGAEWSMRGDFVLYSGVLSEVPVDSTNLWRMDGDEPEKVNFLEDAKDYLLGSYLSGNTFFYFKPNDGYYKMDLESGEKELLFENQLENGRSIILNEDYMVEFNFYYGFASEEKYLKFYNGEKWINVELPEELEQFDGSNSFTAKAVASDRVFMVKNYYSIDNGSSSSSLYYFMINSNKPELILCDTVGDVIEEEESTKGDEKTEGYIDIEDIVVFDTENYLVKITGVDLHYDKPETKNEVEDEYVIHFYYENHTSKKYHFCAEDATVNGLIYSPKTFSNLEANQTGEFIICLEDEAREQFHVPTLYTREEYSDISFQFKIAYKDAVNNTLKESMIHIYPFGEANATQYVREPQDSDKVVMEDDEIKMTFVGYDTKVIDNDTVVFYIENKVEDTISLRVTESTTVNGHSLSSYSILSPDSVRIFGNSGALVSFELEDEAYTMTEIEKYEIGYWKLNINTNLSSYLDKIILEP